MPKLPFPGSTSISWSIKRDHTDNLVTFFDVFPSHWSLCTLCSSNGPAQISRTCGQGTRPWALESCHEESCSVVDNIAAANPAAVRLENKILCCQLLVLISKTHWYTHKARSWYILRAFYEFCLRLSLILPPVSRRDLSGLNLFPQKGMFFHV